MSTSPSFDIVGLGCSAVDDLLYLDGYPPPDAKVSVRARQRQCGGLTATALVAAARLGAKCAYAGILGDDGGSAFVTSALSREGIDLSLAPRLAGAGPILSTIIVDRLHNTRNIFCDLSGSVDPIEEPGLEELVRAGRVLFLDHVTPRRSLRAARIARGAGIPIVADIERNDFAEFEELLANIDHLIVSRDFAAQITGHDDPAQMARHLWTGARHAVVVTCGDQGAWFTDSASAAPIHQAAFKVDVVDTTGCGDVFHGAYAAGLAQNMPLPQRIRVACAAAGIKAMHPGGQSGIPSRTAVESFLGSR